MRRNTIIAVAVALLVLAAALLTWRYVDRMADRMADLGRQVEELGKKADEAQQRAAEAAARADEAQREAGEAAGRAEEAAAREQESAGQARAAEAARALAETKTRKAETARAEAELLAEVAAKARREAEEQRIAAERETTAVRTQAEQAAAEARQVRAELAEIKRRQQEEVGRLQRAMSKIADTKITALGVVMNLDSSQIEFDFNKAELRPRNREVLSRIAGVLLTFQDYSIQVYGHTDAIGNVEYNQKLSERRAEAVRDYLVEAGVDPAILTTRGMGKSSPLVEGTDPVSRQRNRRVELAIVFSEGEYEAVVQDE